MNPLFFWLEDNLFFFPLLPLGARTLPVPALLAHTCTQVYRSTQRNQPYAATSAGLMYLSVSDSTGELSTEREREREREGMVLRAGWIYIYMLDILLPLTESRNYSLIAIIEYARELSLPVCVL
jgi:hypothetical protein